MARIIIVEDDDIVAEIANDALTAAGHLLSEVQDGAMALAAISDTGPDLIILDYNLPGQSGMEILRGVRSQPHLEATPVMMLTSNRTRLLRARAEEAGIDDYLVKPFTPENLVRQVEALLVGRAISLTVRRLAAAGPADH